MPTTAFKQLTISMYLGLTKRFHQYPCTHVNHQHYKSAHLHVVSQ